MAKHLRAVPYPGERSPGLPGHSLHPREPLSCLVPEHGRGNDHDEQQHHRGDYHRQERRLVPVEEVDRGEHDRPEDDQGHDVQQGLRNQRSQHDREVLARMPGAAGNHHGPRRLTQPSGKRRRHQDADERSLHGI